MRNWQWSHLSLLNARPELMLYCFTNHLLADLWDSNNFLTQKETTTIKREALH